MLHTKMRQATSSTQINENDNEVEDDDEGESEDEHAPEFKALHELELALCAYIGQLLALPSILLRKYKPPRRTARERWTPAIVETVSPAVFDVNEPTDKILVASRYVPRDTISKQFGTDPNLVFLDCTLEGQEQPWCRFDFGFPVGSIPITNSNPSVALTATSIENLWEALKVFDDNSGIELHRLRSTFYSPAYTLQRRRSHAKLLGWQYGLGPVDGGSNRLLKPQEAWTYLLIPAYKYVLKHRLAAEIAAIKKMVAEGKRVVLLGKDDKNFLLPNCVLIKLFLEGMYPI